MRFIVTAKTIILEWSQKGQFGKSCFQAIWLDHGIQYSIWLAVKECTPAIVVTFECIWLASYGVCSNVQQCTYKNMKCDASFLNIHVVFGLVLIQTLDYEVNSKHDQVYNQDK